MRRYQHGGDIYTREIRYDFSANINPLGMPEAVREAAGAAAAVSDCYPDPSCGALRRALSVCEDVPAERIVCGNGAADLIYRLVHALRPRRALLCAPSFSEYEKALREAGCGITYCYLREEDNFLVTERFVEQLKALRPDICFLCSPGNPAGGLIPAGLMGQIAALCPETGTVLAVDECFLPFVRDGKTKSAVRFLNENVLILKAFTKIYAMAGLRLGYALCGGERMTGLLKESGQCWSVSTPAQAAGIAALKQKGFVERTVETVERERAYLAGELAALGFLVYPSEANFILFRDMRQSGPKPAPAPQASRRPGADEPPLPRQALTLEAALLREKIAIRSCSNYEGLTEGYYRIAVRPHAENVRLIEAAAAYCAKREERT